MKADWMSGSQVAAASCAIEKSATAYSSVVDAEPQTASGCATWLIASVFSSCGT
jgi:hypothetical protein